MSFFPDYPKYRLNPSRCDHQWAGDGRYGIYCRQCGIFEDEVAACKHEWTPIDGYAWCKHCGKIKATPS